MTKKDIRTYSLEQLQTFFEEKNLPKYRAKQVYQWIWKKGVYNFMQMTNLPKELIALLDIHFVINHINIDKIQKSTDGTIKNTVRLYDGLLVESVLIPTSTRTTACVSSQVGCSLNCTFCATATIKRMRNLNVDEIIDQVMVIDKQSRVHYNMPLKNIVFMGMGEPLMNYNNVCEAIDKITGTQGLAMSPKRITLSTAGIPKMIKKMADKQVKFKLAISLHSAIEETRNQLMPFTKKIPLELLKEAICYWYAKTKSKVTYEYIIWKGINDNQKEALALAKFCSYIPSKVNLIQYNSIENNQYIQADQEAIDMYMNILENKGIVTKIRKSRGDEIDAACGQLANKRISEQNQILE